jgi:hypothetical protein
MVDTAGPVSTPSVAKCKQVHHLQVKFLEPETPQQLTGGRGYKLPENGKGCFLKDPKGFLAGFITMSGSLISVLF